MASPLNSRVARLEAGANIGRPHYHILTGEGVSSHEEWLAIYSPESNYNWCTSSSRFCPAAMLGISVSKSAMGHCRTVFYRNKAYGKMHSVRAKCVVKKTCVSSL